MLKTSFSSPNKAAEGRTKRAGPRVVVLTRLAPYTARLKTPDETKHVAAVHESSDQNDQMEFE